MQIMYEVKSPLGCSLTLYWNTSYCSVVIGTKNKKNKTFAIIYLKKVTGFFYLVQKTANALCFLEKSIKMILGKSGNTG